MKIKTFSNLHGIPKIHKSKIISNVIKEQGSEYISSFEPKDLELYPTAVGHICPSKRLSDFDNTLLKPLLSKTKRYVKDDFDFLKNERES